MEEWQNPITIVLLLIGGILLVGTLISFGLIFIKTYIEKIRAEEQQKAIIQLSHQKELLAANIITQEKERSRIALNVHDNLIAQLYRVKLVNNNTSINKMLKASIATARNISHDLSPPLLTQTTIKELFLDFLQPFQKTHTIKTIFTINENILIETYKKLQLFRIFQEVVINSNKHAQAKRIEIYFRNLKKHTILIIKDNGIGFKAPKKGLGLQNIELRAQMLKGVYRLKTARKQGTIFSLCIRNEK